MSAPALTSYVNGISQVSGDNLNTMQQWAVTYAQLKAFSPNPAVPNMAVYMQGYNAAGDGGQGNFYWNTTTGTDDGGVTTIVPTSSTSGCWSRIPNYSPIYTPQTVSTSSSVTLTAANVTNNVLFRSASGTWSDTLPLASAIIGALSGSQSGSIKDLLVINGSGNTYTLNSNSGVTFTGNTATSTTFTLSSGVTRLLKIYLASSTAVTVYG